MSYEGLTPPDPIEPPVVGEYPTTPYPVTPPAGPPVAPSAAPPAAAYPPPSTPPGYAATPGQFPKTSTYAVVSLVLAIGSFVLCPVILSIAALVVASSADKEIKASNGWITGDGMVKAAKIIAWINIAITIVVIIGFIALFVVARTSETVGSFPA